MVFFIILFISKYFFLVMRGCIFFKEMNIVKIDVLERYLENLVLLK